MRKRYLAAIVATIAATPLLMTHQAVSAASAHDCAGNHQWNIPVNTIGPVFAGSETESWDRSCANVDTSAPTFGIATVTHDVSPGTIAVSTFSGDCAFGFSTFVNGGIRFFIGPVAVGAGVQGTAAAASVGVLGVPSVTPCSGGTTITWTGVENFTGTP
jgi:hypothetical protein